MGKRLRPMLRKAQWSFFTGSGHCMARVRSLPSSSSRLLSGSRLMQRSPRRETSLSATASLGLEARSLARDTTFAFGEEGRAAGRSLLKRLSPPRRRVDFELGTRISELGTWTDLYSGSFDAGAPSFEFRVPRLQLPLSRQQRNTKPGSGRTKVAIL